MAGVYEPHWSEGYQWAVPMGDRGYVVTRDMINHRRGERVGDRWTPMRMYLRSQGDDGEHLYHADMPWFGGSALVVAARARMLLEEVLGDDAELLPLACDDEDLWLVNAWRMVDALDEGHSELRRFSGGRVMRVIRYVFREEAVRGLACFKIPQLRGVMFVTDDVVEAVQSAGLTGVRFRALWQSQ